jgi:PAS domain S-box-containing protein
LEQGNFLTHLATFKDITECKQAEEAFAEQQVLGEKQRLIQQIAESTSAVLYIFDLIEQRNVYVNRQITEILGYSPEAVQAMGAKVLPTLTHPDDLAKIAAHFQQFATTKDGEVLEIEYRMRDANGEWRWLINQEIVFARTADGLPQQILGTATDITRLKTLNATLEQQVSERTEELRRANEHLKQEIRERQQAEEALRESEERFRATFEQAAVGICQSSLDGRFLRLNQKFCDLVGYTHEEMLNRTWMDITYPEDLDAGLELVQRMWQKEIDTYTLQKRYIRKDGSIIWVNIACSLVRESSGEPKYTIALVEDISDRKQAEDKLHQNEFNLLEAQRIAHIGSWELDLNTQKITWSEETFRIFGLDSSQGEPNLAQHIHQQIHPDDLALWQTIVEQALVDGQPYEMEIRILPTDGSIRYVVARGEAVVNEQGQVIRLLGTVMDISDRKQAEETLRLQAERERLIGLITQRIRQSLNLDEILNTTVEEVRQLLQNDRVVLFKLCKDGVGRVITESISPGVPATVGEEFPDEVFPEKIYQYYCQGKPRVVPNIAQDEFAACITEYLQNLGVKSKIVIPILRNSQEGETANSCLQNPETALWGVMTAHDCSGLRQWQQWEIDLLCSLATQIGIAIQQSELYFQLEAQLTELKQAKAALQQAKEVAEIANRAKSEFLANMSHELRTPLNGILGYTQLLKRDTNLTDQQQNSLNIIHQCGEHLLTLIEDVLDLSKIEAQKMELYPTEFHLPNFLKCISDLFQMRTQQKDISFTYQIISPLPQGVNADKKRLRQVLSNLLSNAVKFTDRGGVTFKVGYVRSFQFSVLSSELEDSTPNSPKIRFQVEDTGIGIESSKLAEIFLPFHQVGDRSRAVEGTGLGLAISQKLVQMMGSEIKVRSTLEKGSVFWFDLDLPEISGWHEPNSSDDRRIVGFKGDKHKVLIVDDYLVNRSFLRDLLEPLGFEILEAVDGQDCLNKAAVFEPDLILMDLVMPGLDGLEATRRLRQLPQLKNMVAIALSANVFESTKQESLAAGCQDFLPKPVQAKQLLESLTVHLGVEWIYEDHESHIGVEPNRDRASVVPPPPSEIATLFKLVKMGDIVGILDQAEKLEKLDNKLKPFATQVRQLTKGFKLKQLQGIIQQYMADSQRLKNN